MNQFDAILTTVNVTSKDDGRRFTVTDRADAIRELISGSTYQLLHDGDISLIYGRNDFTPTDSFALISCHIDSIYGRHFHSDFDCDSVLGTFDNSICNAILLRLMLRDALPSSVLVAFTGDEEGSLHGVDDVVAFIQQRCSRLEKLELVITLDITSEAYGARSYTVENLIVGKRRKNSKLRFRRREQLADYVRHCLQDSGCHMVFDADPDESGQYREYGLGCITFCVPTSPHPENTDLSVGR